MWGVQGTLQAPHLSAATGLRLASPAARRSLVERVQTSTRVGRVFASPGVLVVECKDEGVRYCGWIRIPTLFENFHSFSCLVYFELNFELKRAIEFE